MDRPMQNDQQPVVCIRISGQVPDTVVDCIGWGLEEEGIPLQSAADDDHAGAARLAKTAAQASRLHVGIGIHAASGQVVLHHRDMPDDRPLFTQSFSPVDREALMRLGQNAARLVKGNPFLMSGAPAPEPGDAGERVSRADAVERLAARIVQELLVHFQER